MTSGSGLRLLFLRTCRDADLPRFVFRGRGEGVMLTEVLETSGLSGLATSGLPESEPELEPSGPEERLDELWRELGVRITLFLVSVTTSARDRSSGLETPPRSRACVVVVVTGLFLLMALGLKALL